MKLATLLLTVRNSPLRFCGYKKWAISKHKTLKLHENLIKNETSMNRKSIVYLVMLWFYCLITLNSCIELFPTTNI